jgi:dUTP pyrophosphatase
MKVNFKKIHPGVPTPKYARPGDACIDLTAVAVEVNTEHDYIEYKTGIAVEIPDGFVGLMYPRSSVTNHFLMMKNSVGVIDSGYRGELKVRFQSTFPGLDENIYVIGDRVAQLLILPIPQIEIEIVDELSDSVRGTGGYGSSGR